MAKLPSSEETQWNRCQGLCHCRKLTIFSSHRGPSQCSYCGLMKHHLLPSQLGPGDHLCPEATHLSSVLSWNSPGWQTCLALTHSTSWPYDFIRELRGHPQGLSCAEAKDLPSCFHEPRSPWLAQSSHFKVRNHQGESHLIHIHLPTVLTQWTLDKEVLSGQLVRQQVWNHS